MITGSSDGIGVAVAERLLRDGASRVVLHARSRERGERVLHALAPLGDVSLVTGEFTVLDQVRAMADDVLERYARIDILVNDAGVGSATPRPRTIDGFELTWQVNYLAAYLLTARLRERIGASAPSLIMNVSSVGHELEAIHFDDLALRHRSYPRIEAYCQSKPAMIMCTYDLADALRDCSATVNALHLGTYVDTKTVRQSKNAPLTSLDDGAASVVHLVSGSGVADSTGGYYDMLQHTRSSAASRDREQRRRLHEVKERLRRWL
ncbi:3-oxoacyl-ACP reductase [Vulcanimicrobium alpinum]|uniref:3-oxoacyl-ACP reductase n=1 Tax=Vulcanimicrobium alpinum TaxID=3016050 RepID=A0AAN1XWX2_UNVUL|nr:3-oxoacyl-ACP reductase [Vulcanimicrobium alpinum]